MDSIELLYQQYFKDVYLYLKAMSKSDDVAEELTQETFLKAIKGIGKFRGDCDIRVWLCQIAKNNFYKYCDRNKKFVLEEMTETFADESISLEKDVVDKERNAVLKDMLDKMEEPYRSVFHLRIFGELSFREIGSAMQRKENWARVTYYRAKCGLAKEMEEVYGKDEL